MSKSLEKQPFILPGEYDGVMGGYEVEIIFKNGNKSDSIRMDAGIRCKNCAVKVIVDEENWVIVDI